MNENVIHTGCLICNRCKQTLAFKCIPSERNDRLIEIVGVVNWTPVKRKDGSLYYTQHLCTKPEIKKSVFKKIFRSISDWFRLMFGEERRQSDEWMRSNGW